MSRITTCPHCSSRLSLPEGITYKTQICPHCLAEVDNPQPGAQIQAADINTDVKRDLNVGCIVLAVLMGFCFLGIAIVIGNTEMPLGTQIALLFFACVALFVLLCIAIIRGQVRRGSSGETVGIVFLVLGTIVAIAIFGFFCCAAGVNESFRHLH